MEPLRQIEEIFQEALQRDFAERDAYVRQACRGDTELEREVSSLLANHKEASRCNSWPASAAAQLIAIPRSLRPGQSLGPYRIESFLAAGGMGEVYRATDTRLHRQVAIKVSPGRFSERFEREARVIASLNHPNICQLYDVGPNYLVMELVEGPTLADRIRQGALPMDEALATARQIAGALEAAHEKGRVHRDLKPANIKITPDGAVKLLDFGLAKAAEEPAGASDPSDSPTQTISATRTGVILGTAAYMSPEQARGAVVDKRADIWAFGCVLYEMLTGRRAFSGETTSDILASVLKEEPDWSRIPARVQPLLRRCLVKDPKQRLRDIGDAMPLLEATPEVAPSRRPWPWIVAALAVAFTVAGVGWWRTARSATPPLGRLVQLSASLPFGTAVPVNGNQIALSPDARRIAISIQDASGTYRLAARMLDQAQFVPLSGTEGALLPFFSPDGQWIGFFADGKLKKIGVQGTAPVTLCEAAGPLGASWGDDDNIVAAISNRSGLSRLPSAGGEPVQLTLMNKEKGETAHAWPQVLPRSQAVLFTARSGGSWNNANIDVVMLKTGERKTVLRGGYFGRYMATSNDTGSLLYIHQDTLFAAPFDLNRLATTGASEPLLEDMVLSAGLAGSANFDFSPAPHGSGTFVYFSPKGEPPQSIFWLDGTGKIQPLYPVPGSYSTPRFSPDGRRLAFRILSGAGRGDIWVQDLGRGVPSRLTTSGISTGATWTSNGAGIVFETLLGDTPSLYWSRADGSGEPQRLTNDGVRRIPGSFSPNGNRLAYAAYAREEGGRSRIWTVPIEGDSDHPRLGQAEVFLQTPFSEGAPAFSPDGRWLAYISNETGTREVYVRPFPGPGAERRISTAGGSNPVWSRSSRELFFIGWDRHIMVASYTTNGDAFVPGKPRVWSERRLLGVPYFTYDVAPDGIRIAAILYADGTAESQPQVTVLLNFFDELRRRVPAGGK